MDTQTKTATVDFAKPPTPDQLRNFVPAAQLPATMEARTEDYAQRPVIIMPAKIYPAKIAKAILAVTAEIGQVEKLGKNEFQRYKYASWQDVNDKLSPLLSRHGLIIIQSEKSRSLLEQNEQGSILAIVYECTIVNEDGDSWPPIEWTAIARLRDGKGVSDDKAAPKCATQGEKYFCMKLFKIRTAEEGQLDSDADDGTGKAGGRPPKAMGGETESAEPTAIYVAKGGAKAWHKAFCAAIRQMATRANLDQLGVLNIENMKTLEAADAKLYASAKDAYALRLGELPKDEPQPVRTSNERLPAGTPMGDAVPGKPLPPLVGGKAAEQRAQAAATGANPSTGELEDKIPDQFRRMNMGEEQAWLTGIRSMLESAESRADVIALQEAALTMGAKNRVSAGGWAAAIQEFHARAQFILDHPPFDGDAWIKTDLAGALSSAEDPETLEQKKLNVLIPHKDKLTPAQWKIAVRMYRERLDEVDPANALGGG